MAVANAFFRLAVRGAIPWLDHRDPGIIATDMVTIRPARWEDRNAITALIAAMGSHEDILDAPDPPVRLGQLIADPDARSLVAEVKGKIVGYADLLARASSLHDRVEGWLGALAVGAVPSDRPGGRWQPARCG